MEEWTDIGTEYVSADEIQPECPDWFMFNEWYYLVFGLRGTGNYFMSHEPFGNWTKPENNIVDCGSVPKSAMFKDKRIFVGFKCYDDFADRLFAAEVKQNPDGTLLFEKFAIE